MFPEARLRDEFSNDKISKWKQRPLSQKAGKVCNGILLNFDAVEYDEKQAGVHDIKVDKGSLDLPAFYYEK